MFKSLLSEEYSSEHFEFGFTNISKVKESIEVFVEELLVKDKTDVFTMNPKVKPKIRVHESSTKNCQNENENNFVGTEHFKFQQSQVYRAMVVEASKRLGFKHKLSSDKLNMIWDMCRYNYAWNPEDESAWCTAFEPEHLRILEYLEDLHFFYKASYGNKVNSRIMCAEVKAMKEMLQGETGQKVSVYFTDESAILNFLTTLHYAKDKTHLTADNYVKMKERNFKTSSLTPFTSSLAVVKYK